MNQNLIQEFENILRQVLSYEGLCEGEVGDIKIEKDTSLITRMGMSKGLVGFIYVRTPEMIKPEDIRPLLRKGEEIELGYTKFTSKGAKPQSFYISHISKHGWQNLLTVDKNSFSTYVREDENKREHINGRALEIIKNYLEREITS